jgi:AcrR family transcriptional regulator
VEAAELFRRRGYHIVGIRDILQAAGVSRGSFYYHFASKSELISEVMAHWQKVIPIFLDGAFDGADWEATCRHFAKRLLGTGPKTQIVAAPLTHLGIECAGRNKKILAEVAALMKLIEGYMARALVRCGYPAAGAQRRAETMFALVEGHFLRLVLTRSPRCRKDLLHDIIALIKPPSKRRVPAPVPVESGAAERVKEFLKNRLDIIDNRSSIKLAGDGTRRHREKRREILRRAALLFWQNGYHAVPVDAILQPCGVPKGSFNYYFESKQALALEVLENYKAQFDRSLDAVLSTESWVEALDAYYLMLRGLGFGGQLDASPVAALGLEFAENDSKLRERAAEILLLCEKRLAEAARYYLGNGCDSRAIGARATALWEGHLVRLAVYGESAALERLREDLFEIGIDS